MYGNVRQIGFIAMTRDQIVKVSKEAARKSDTPRSGTPPTKKQLTRFEELKRLRKAAEETPEGRVRLRA